MPATRPGKTGVTKTWNKNGRLIRMFCCWYASAIYLGVVSGAIRFFAQRHGRVTRHAPIGSLERDTRFRLVRIHGCGIERSTWLKRGNGTELQSRLRHPFLGWPEFQAADSILFARGWWNRGQRRGPSARCWAPVGGLRSRQNLLASWLCASPRAVGRLSLRFQMLYCGSQHASLASSYET